LKAIAPEGITEGSLEIRNGYLKLPVIQ